jgi:murein DD-endopeptidase MepM/ murein hydrolase activator NlpD
MEELRLQNPIKPARNGIILMTQPFGANDVNYYSQWGLKGHNGIDYSTKHMDKGEAWVLASMDGYVISDKTIQSDSKGRFVTTMSKAVLINGREAKVECCYFHLKEAKVSVTDPLGFSFFTNKVTRFIRAGTLIGISDNTGKYTTGAHLHFHTRIYWKQDNGYYTPDYNNGYDGCIDPMPFFKDDKVYQLGSNFNSTPTFWYNGKKITRAEVNKIVPVIQSQR